MTSLQTQSPLIRLHLPNMGWQVHTSIPSTSTSVLDIKLGSSCLWMKHSTTSHPPFPYSLRREMTMCAIIMLSCGKNRNTLLTVRKCYFIILRAPLRRHLESSNTLASYNPTAMDLAKPRGKIDNNENKAVCLKRSSFHTPGTQRARRNLQPQKKAIQNHRAADHCLRWRLRSWVIFGPEMEGLSLL